VSLRSHLTPPRLLVLSFLGLILAGTLGLELLPGLYVGEPLSWLDALFTATSAVCVTGLIVVDTATYFTHAGQLFILLLIQLGGLGILTFTTLVILALGRRLSLQQEAVTASNAEVAPEVDFRQLVRKVILFTLVFEGGGALILFLTWLPRFDPLDAAWHALFQSVSAFCNAGFSTFSDSLMGFQDSPVGLTVIMALIVLGGLGFLTLEELHIRWRRKNEAPRLSLHSRMVLGVTAVLLVGGAIAFCGLEWRNTLGNLPTWQKILNGMFMSVTTRTAGFNTVDYGATADSTDFVSVLLMSIGGSPGSTAGGMKTTTVAVIVVLALARLRGHETTSAWSRTIPEETVQRAVGLFVVGFASITIAILLYAVVEVSPVGPAKPGSFLSYMFEAVSAFNTVGLSTGVTSSLNSFSKLLTILLMYVGRVGPLTFAAAIALRRRTRRGEFRYAYEDVIIG
jgi:trk system potassium uptake protein TrkH